MKKLSLLLCALSIVFSSCSSDDDSGSQDPIIGIWKPFKSFEDGVEVPFGTCREMDRLTFSSNGSYSVLFYEENNGTCNAEESENGQWSKNSGDSYSFTIFGETSTEDFFFSGNTFYVEYTDTEGVTDPVIVTFRDVFIRVE